MASKYKGATVLYKPLNNQQEQKTCPQIRIGKRKRAFLLGVGGLLVASLFVLYILHNYASNKLLVVGSKLPTNNILDPHLAVLAEGAKSSTTGSSALVNQLYKLIFLNVGLATRKDKFVWKKMPCLYLESQNVSMPYIVWADVGECNYMHQENDGYLVSPPSGMRSSIPHGGISTGVFEVRADGTFHEWTIFNQYPAGAAKIQIIDDMFMAVRTQENSKNGRIMSKILQTHPTSSLPVDAGVWALEYKGSYPVSKLTVSDPELPVDMSVFVYHWYKHNDMNTSATPAVAFTAVLTNPSTTTSYNASFLMNLPLGIEPHTHRGYPQMPPIIDKHLNSAVNGDRHHNSSLVFSYLTYDGILDKLPKGHTREFKLKSSSETDMVMECFNGCSKNELCQSWTLDVDGKTCYNFDGHVRLNGHRDGFYSGVKTHWSTDSECLTVDRNTPGYSTNGNMSLCTYSSDEKFTISMGAGDDLMSMWSDFTASGQIPGMSDDPHVTGMVSGQVTLEPGETKEVTIVLGWYFPDRDFLGIPVGNYYSHLVRNSSHAARLLGRNLQNAVSDASKLHSTFFGSDVPPTLQDMLINSLSHIRSAFWLKDGRWRQWEAHDCVNIDSVHNDGERHIPYIMIFPDSVMNKMRAWASFQLPNGMIQEQLRCGCTSLYIEPTTVEFGCGRVMSDVSSMFIVYLLEILQWHPDPATNKFVEELWPYAKRAAQWHLDISREGGGLPKYLVTTYDVLHLVAYPYASYNGAFHLLAMKAATKLAEWMNDTTFAAECDQAFSRGQVAMDKFLWNNTHNYYNAYFTTKEQFDKESFFSYLNINLCSFPEHHRPEWGECLEGDPTTPGAIMTDTFYAQVLAYSLGLGTLVEDENKLRSHLKAEREQSDTDKGMTVLTGRFAGPNVPYIDNAIWMMGDANWASISIHLGEDVEVALKEMLEPFDYWRTGLNEIWNVAGILSSGDYTDPSVPYITSHYGYYMSSWHVLFALTGQDVDVNAKKVSFSPKIKPPFKLPFMIPTVWGTLESEIVDTVNSTISDKINSRHLQYTFALEFGELEFVTVTANGCQYVGTKRILSLHSPLQWECSYSEE